jgi:putative ABC transport system ATP-binding protein
MTAQGTEPSRLPLIRLRGITKVYGSGATAFLALKGVDLDIEQGDFVAIMGPSGSGKSTAMNTLGCLDTPSSGEYFFQGVRVDSLTRDERARLRRRYLGFVFQGFNLLARTSAQENVELPLVYRGEPAAQRHALAAQALDAVGLKGWGHHTPSELSGGQQQRVAIARALAMEPEILLFDEPTSSLDPELVGEVLRVIRKLAKEGRTMLLVTHELGFAYHFATKVIFLADGVFHEVGTPDEVLKNPREERTQAFLQRFTEFSF